MQSAVQRSRALISTTKKTKKNYTYIHIRGVDPYGTGGHASQYLWRGDIHGNVPAQYFRSKVVKMLTQVTATVVCCILTQILCVVSQKASASGGLHPPDPLPGLHPWTPLGDFVSQTPNLLLCPPNNPVRSTPLSVRYRWSLYILHLRRRHEPATGWPIFWKISKYREI